MPLPNLLLGYFNLAHPVYCILMTIIQDFLLPGNMYYKYVFCQGLKSNKLVKPLLEQHISCRKSFCWIAQFDEVSISSRLPANKHTHTLVNKHTDKHDESQYLLAWPG